MKAEIGAWVLWNNDQDKTGARNGWTDIHEWKSVFEPPLFPLTLKMTIKWHKN